MYNVYVKSSVISIKLKKIHNCIVTIATEKIKSILYYYVIIDTL